MYDCHMYVTIYIYILYIYIYIYVYVSPVSANPSDLGFSSLQHSLWTGQCFPDPNSRSCSRDGSSVRLDAIWSDRPAFRKPVSDCAFYLLSESVSPTPDVSASASETECAVKASASVTIFL